MKPSKAHFGGETTTGTSSITLELDNKLQTKRNNATVDLAFFKINSVYNLKPTSGQRRGGSLSDILFDLELRPYSWLSIDGDTTYKHTDRGNVNYNRFSTANLDVNFNFAEERTIGIGQRYLRKGTNELTQNLVWRLTPKWKFSAYQRRNVGHDPTAKRGLREQEYSISRDLHCWTVDLTYNTKRGYGESIWLIFRIKAFPENEFGFDQSYHQPKKGATPD